MFKKSSNAPTTYGRPRLRSSAALHSYQMKRMAEFEAHSSLLEAAQQAEHPVMARKCTTFHEDAPWPPEMYELQWSEATLLSLSLENVSLMSFEKCFDPR